MSIVAKASKTDFSPAPEGLHPAVCIDVIDLGMVKVEYKNKIKEQHMIRIRWAIDENDPKTGKQFWVSKRFTLSLHEKANLRKMLETWRSRAFTAEELDGFDVEQVIGSNCQVQVQHNVGDNGTTYGNVVAVVKAAKGMVKLPIPSDYIRECDKEKRQELESHPDGEITDDDIPF